jgi:hypothetical protein
MSLPTINLSPGILPPPACYSTEQDRFDAYVAAIIASITGGIQWEASASAPADLTKYWLRTDSNGRPLEALKWSTTDGAWVRWLAEINNTATAAGSANAYTLTNSPATTAPVAYRPGSTYIFKATFANTGACTLNVDGLGAVTIKKRVSVDLETGDILSGQVVVVVHDGTNFQLATPAKPQTIFQDTALYAEGNTTAVVPAAPADIILTVTKPAGTTWKEFSLQGCLSWRANSTNVEVGCVMTFESGTITGANVTTKPGCGNSPQLMLGQANNEDSNNAFWQRLGPIPPEYLALNTIAFRLHINVIAGSFEQASTFYGWLRATYTEPIP